MDINSFPVELEANMEKEVKYVVEGADGYYAFSDTLADLPRQLGFLHYCGMTLQGIDGEKGFSVDLFMERVKAAAARG